VDGITPDDETSGETPRRPGRWPVDRTELPEPEPNRDYTRVQARFTVTFGALRAALEEQPSPALVRATGRRWINQAAQIIDEVATDMQDKNKERDR
jgi:hypothetical protein